MDSTIQKFSQVYPSSLETSRFVADDLKEYCKDFSLSDDTVNELELCVVEIVNNAFIHGYQNTEGNVIEVDMFIEKDKQIEINISDFGVCMSYEQFNQAINGEFIEPVLEDPDTWTTSGRGFIIIQALLDEISLLKEEGRNTFTLIKQL